MAVLGASFGAFILTLIGFGVGYITARSQGLKARIPQIASAPANCKHKRWTVWKIEQLKAIHIYNEPDDGKDLPDRVDSYITRQCSDCGLPQAKTVRGIDSPHFK